MCVERKKNVTAKKIVVLKCASVCAHAFVGRGREGGERENCQRKNIVVLLCVEERVCPCVCAFEFGIPYHIGSGIL